MSDTQWKRFQVFVQEAAGRPHLDYGSVHAPDTELALLNARDVFARRPDCVSMWIVPSEKIYSITAETLNNRQAVRQSDKQALPELYIVFIKSRQTGTMSYAGEVLASSPGDALERALVEFEKGPPVLVWWVFPERAVVKSELRDIDSYFAPAREKSFRLSNDFHTVTDMRKIKHSAGRGTE